MKTFNEYLSESFIKEPKELLPFASADSNGMLTDDIRFYAKHWVNTMIKSSRNYPSDKSIAQYHIKFIDQVNKSAKKITDPEMNKKVKMWAETVWDNELSQAGI